MSLLPDGQKPRPLREVENVLMDFMSELTERLLEVDAEAPAAYLDELVKASETLMQTVKHLSAAREINPRVPDQPVEIIEGDGDAVHTAFMNKPQGVAP